MGLLINLPDEFVSHYEKDKFKDSLERIIFDLRSRLGNGDVNLAGNYEIEVLEMLMAAFENSSVDDLYRIRMDMSYNTMGKVTNEPTKYAPVLCIGKDGVKKAFEDLVRAHIINEKDVKTDNTGMPFSETKWDEGGGTTLYTVQRKAEAFPRNNIFI